MIQVICQTCKGNGFICKKQILIQVWNFAVSFVRTIQCKNCKSEGEIKVNDSKMAKISNACAKVYNGVDILTIMRTDKSMKRHIYDNAKKAWVETKEGKKYIYDQSIDLFKNK